MFCLPLMGSDEACNGGDDDCDGQIDEGFPGLGTACSLGEGRCAQDGVLVCTDDGQATTCNAQAGDGGPERCDGIDNDCDSRTDEGFPLGAQCTVGIGLCRQNIVCDRMTGDTRCEVLNYHRL